MFHISLTDGSRSNGQRCMKHTFVTLKLFQDFGVGAELKKKKWKKVKTTWWLNIISLGRICG